MTMQTNNRHLDNVRAVNQAAREGLAPITATELRSMKSSLSIALDWTREAYKKTRNRPDLQEYLRRAGAELSALSKRLDEESGRGRAH